ncbi:hypothetical protein [uncultured Sulfitobacter sp.]|uniref:hypothetical protein n=1 Tax=uncultured Sulfitobacter sp. TaxID=191468 RepID=UPI0026342A8A|nr:hypothetical protein [uncultured Sulfitobacter sp.]
MTQPITQQAGLTGIGGNLGKIAPKMGWFSGLLPKGGIAHDAQGIGQQRAADLRV